MRLISFQVKNYRSIVDSGEIRIEPLQALVGENNSGKSNLLYALQVFLTAGAGGVSESSFYDPNEPIVITANFGELKADERKRLRKYLLGDRLILEKQIALEDDKRSGKIRPKPEYHGYMARPVDWWLSTDGVLEHTGSSKPKWEQIAEEHGIIDYVRDPKTGKVNKTSYEAGLNRLLVDRDDIEFEEPELGGTQALGLQPVLLDELPVFRLLPAITDYSDEIDRRASQTNFRLLMGDLSERIIKYDPRYSQIEDNIRQLRYLLNVPQEGEERQEGQERLAILEAIEIKLKDIISRLMPSVTGIQMTVEVEEAREVFSKGISILIDDGRLTEVLAKGHGLQRCVVFGLLQALILNQRGQLIEVRDGSEGDFARDERTIILGIEEPELYIHPQMQRLIYGVLKAFTSSDQVVYSTHSPAFVDVGKYESIAVVRKDSVVGGTKVKQCEAGVLDALTERKTFQFVSSFGLEQNSMFFAKNVVLVEGEEDVIAVLATGRELDLFKDFPEEIGYTLASTNSKQEMPKYMKLLNGFNVPYTILHELDGDPESEKNMAIKDLLGQNRAVELPNKLEDAVGHDGHFHRAYDAMKFFQNPDNITEQLRNTVKSLFRDVIV